MNGTTSVSPELARLRNNEEFASLGQFLFNYGSEVLGLPHEFGREELETELLTVGSEMIHRICIGLLKMVSSQRGLTMDIFEEYTRRQYYARKPESNPFGDDAAAPTKFWDLDVVTRAKVLHQLSVWVFLHPDRIREKMKGYGEQEQLDWRVEPCGYDRDGNTYYILDDNRLYRQTPWIMEPRPVKRAKITKRNKRRRVSTAVEEEPAETLTEWEGGEWSCVCITLQDWTTFIGGLEKSKDPDEKALCAHLKEDVMPIINKVWQEKEKQRQLEAAVANRKRSSRLDEKLARQRQEEERAAAARREAEAATAAEREKMEAEKKEKEREMRLKLREQRLKERELAKTQGSRATTASAEDSSSSATRRSSRRAVTEKKQETKGSEESWVFDCLCGAHGMNYEDGTDIIACDSCDVWQHLKCQNLPPGGEDAEFICDLCLKYRKCAEGPAGPDGLPPSPQIIKLRVGPPSPEKTRAPPPESADALAAIVNGGDSSMDVDGRPTSPSPAQQQQHSLMDIDGKAGELQSPAQQQHSSMDIDGKAEELQSPAQQQHSSMDIDGKAEELQSPAQQQQQQLAH